MNAKVEKLLKNKIWNLGTYGDEPNVVPVLFKEIMDDGRLLVGDVFLKTTLSNVERNGKIAVSVCDSSSLEGYQIKGRAEYVTDGPMVEKFKTMVETAFKGAATAKGALVITPETIIVTTPGPDNKKVL